MDVSWWLVSILCLSPIIPGSGYNVIRKDPFASLSETLVTHQTASCDGDILHMECPPATKISIQLVLYGRQAPSDTVCPATKNQPRIFTGYEGFSCKIAEALRTVEELCQGKKSCSMITSPVSLGVKALDTCPGIRKYIEVAYKCHPTSYKPITICGGDTRSLTCPEPGHSVAILESAFHSVSSGSVHCQVRSDYLRSARLLTTEEAAVSIKQCEASLVTPAVMADCQGSPACLVRAEPESLGVPQCQNLHVALRIIYTCMHQTNFLPRYSEKNSQPEDGQDERRELGQSPSEPELISTSVVAGSQQNSHSKITPEQTATSQRGEDRGWLLQLLYHLIYETFKIVYFIIKSDKWMLVLVLTLSVGLGVSCLLLLIILHLCSLYRTEESHGSSQATPLAPVNLDSDTVDYNDINSQLYTPLPQPKIMKISEEEEPHFQFSTLTRKGKKSSACSPPLDSYLLEAGGDSTVRYSTIGRSSRTNKRTPLIEPELVGPRSLNRSFDNNQLYY